MGVKHTLPHREKNKLPVHGPYGPLYWQGSHYILVLKFKDFSRTFKDP